MQQPVTLLVGQMAQPTGMARVTRAIAQHLAPHRTLHVLGTDVFSPDEAQKVKLEMGQSADTYTLHHNPSDWDFYAERQLSALCEKLHPTSIILYNDPWCIRRLLEATKVTTATGQSKVVAYCPIDGNLVQAGIYEELANLDGIAVPTSFAAQILNTDLGLATLSFSTKPYSGNGLHNIAVIPHGLDLRAFRPLSYEELVDDGEWASATRDSLQNQRRSLARQKLFPNNPHYWSGFWVGNFNRNTSRKKLDLTLQGFARFALGKPANVRLYLHWGAEKVGNENNLVKIARSLGIADRVIFSDNPVKLAAATSAKLNLIYNACEVGINTAVGEGWGLTSFEHAATGAAQIVPAHSACQELWDGVADLLPVEKIITLAGVSEGGLVSPTEVATCLERLYSNKTYYEAQVLNAVAHVKNKVWGWEAIGRSWHDWLKLTETDGSSEPAPIIRDKNAQN